MARNNPVGFLDAKGLMTIERGSTIVTRCGGVSADYVLKLTQTPPKCDGYIVQHLTIDISALSCPGGKSENRQQHQELYEVVSTVQSQDASTWDWTDLNLMVDPLHGRGHGYIKLAREAKFVCSYVSGDLESLWNEKIPGYSTGHATAERPDWWGSDIGEELPASNTWSVTWNCCCGKRAKFHDTAPGDPVQYAGN